MSQAALLHEIDEQRSKFVSAALISKAVLAETPTKGSRG